MRKVTSIFICGVSCLMALGTLGLTAVLVWLLIRARANAGAIDGFGAMGFMIYAELLCIGLLLFGLIPSSILYFFKRQRRDLLSVCLAGFSFIILAGEAIVVYHLPHTGAC